ncbi:hypothetical protein [Halobacillus litoralis]|uniref:hypothetical protein n=1 Tax=Halobacillus litoralis TaxID=45668 RepID=UPI001CFCED2E|nr:hypothetical protein [Halobacillus litoralis]
MVDVMMIRPEKEIGMGCCGGICSDPDGLIHMEDEFSHHDEDRRRLQVIYQTTNEQFGDEVDINFLDPRNLLAVFVYFTRHVKKRNITLVKALKYTVFHIKYNAVFIDGELVNSQADYEERLKTKLER